MAQLPYTDGRDGNGIRDFNELLRFFQRKPLAFYDDSLCASYRFLLSTPEREEAVLAVFDRDGSSAEMLRRIKATSLRTRMNTPAPEVINLLVRYRLRRDFYLQRNPVGSTSPDKYVLWTNMVLVMQDAAEAGQTFFLCENCTAAESFGFAPDPLCDHGAMMLTKPGLGWEPDNTLQVCCAEAQCLRGRKPEESEYLKQKLESLKAAMQASPEERRRLRAAGNACAAAGCSRRELYAGAFKTCSRCRSAHYCSVVCQVRVAWQAEAAPTTALLTAPYAEDALEAAQDLLRQVGDPLMLRRDD